MISGEAEAPMPALLISTSLAAINNNTDSDTITVAAGTCGEAIDFGGLESGAIDDRDGGSTRTASAARTVTTPRCCASRKKGCAAVPGPASVLLALSAMLLTIHRREYGIG